MYLSSLLLPILYLISSINTATIRTSDAEPPEENFWNSYDSQQFYLHSSIKPTQTERLVSVSTGPVLGRLIHTNRNRSAFAFLGVPYAEAAEYSKSQSESYLRF